MSSVQIPNGTGLEQQFAGLDLKQGGHFAPAGGSRYVPPHMRRSGFNPEEKTNPPPQERGIIHVSASVLKGVNNDSCV